MLAFKLRWSRLVWCALALTLSVGACGWEDVTQYGHSIWSEDGERVAYVQQDFKRKTSVWSFRTHTKDLKSQIYTASAANLEAVSPLTGKLQGEVVGFYYMNVPGYILLGRQLSTETVSDGSPVTKVETLRWEKLSEDGQLTVLLQEELPIELQCPMGGATYGDRGLELIPNADGSVIAVVRRGTDCEQPYMTVSFLAADSLTVLVDEQTVDLGALDSALAGGSPFSLYPHFVQVAWTQDDRLLIGSMKQSVKAWSFSPDGQEPELRAEVSPSCMYPESSSSHVNASGETLYITNGGQISVTSAGEESSACVGGCDVTVFGCE